MLLRTFSISISVRSLLLATLAAVAVSAGWLCSERLFLGTDNPEYVEEIRDVVESNGAWPGANSARLPSAAQTLASPKAITAVAPREPVCSVWLKTVSPFRRLFDFSLGYRQLAYFLVGGLWTLLIWSFFGGAISRAAVVQLAREERVGLGEAIGYARNKMGSYFAAPLIPLVGLLVLAIPFIFLGWIMAANFSVIVGALLWILLLATVGLIMAMVAIGVIFGWPLMWGTISAEGSDAFDALSRCYAYTFQRPLHYAFYVLVAALFGLLGSVVVWLFAGTIVEMSYWATAWGAGAERVAAIQQIAGGGSDDSTWLSASGRLIGFWVSCVWAIATGWSYSFFFTVAAAIYLLLRRDVDQTELDEVYLEETDETYGMPPLKSDEAGVPGPADDFAAQEEASDDNESTGETGPPADADE